VTIFGYTITSIFGYTLSAADWLSLFSLPLIAYASWLAWKVNHGWLDDDGLEDGHRKHPAE